MTSLSLSEPLVAGQANDLDRLVGLCDEISALVKTGLPLEESLLHMSRSKRGKIAKKLQELAEKLGTGQSLADAVRNDPRFPPVFAAVVEAGIESGNLSAALDSISECVRTLRDVRLFVLRSSLYPLFLFTALWLVFSFVIFFSIPQQIPFFESYDKHYVIYDWIQFFLVSPVRMALFAVVVPAIFWLLYFCWSFLSGRNKVIQSSGSSPLFGLMPWVGQAAKELQKSSFAQILSTLLRASLPLDRAILLAAQACNDRYWGKENIESLRSYIVKRQNVKRKDFQGQGEETAEHHYPKSLLSPLIDWTLGISNQAMLLEGVQYYSRTARNRANFLLFKCEMFLPAFLTLGLAALIGTCYVVTIMLPFINVLNFLSESVTL